MPGRLEPRPARPAHAATSNVLRQTQAGELPALMGVEKVAIGRAHRPARGGATAAAQDELAGHELAIIFADRALGGTKAGIGAIGAAGPFPDITEHLGKTG